MAPRTHSTLNTRWELHQPRSSTVPPPSRARPCTAPSTRTAAQWAARPRI